MVRSARVTSRVSYSSAIVLLLSVSVQVGCDTTGSQPEITEPAPGRFRVRFETTKGDFVVAVQREWSPYGVDRFYQLVQLGFYDDCAFFSVLKGFTVQFGINGDPKVDKQWRDRTLPDDQVRRSNRRGYVCFAKKKDSQHSRSTQIFINYVNNSSDLDPAGFSPFGRVTEGMEVVDSISAEYRQEPIQSRIEKEGNEYLRRAFPKLDYIKKATVVEE